MTRELQVRDRIQKIQAERPEVHAPVGFVRRSTIIKALCEAYPDMGDKTASNHLDQYVAKFGIKKALNVSGCFYAIQCAVRLFCAVEDWYVERVKCVPNAAKAPIVPTPKAEPVVGPIEPEAMACMAPPIRRQPNLARDMTGALWTLYEDVIEFDRKNIKLRMDILNWLEGYINA